MFLNTEPTVLRVKAEPAKSKTHVTRVLFKYNAVVLLVVMFIVASIISDVFLSGTNIMNVLRQQSSFMIVALGMLMIMLTGGIDLSVSSTVCVCSIMVAYGLRDMGLENHSYGLFVTVLLTIAMGAAFGAINGYLISYLNMPAFIVTLAMMYAIKGVAYIMTDSKTILLNTKIPAVKVIMNFATGDAPGTKLPYTVLLMIIAIAIIFFLMHYTAFGRLVTATGSNENAVQLAGIDTRIFKFWVYVICGVLCAVAGIIVTAKSGSASPLSQASGYDITTIAAVFIVGSILKGGEVNLPMTVVGVFILAVIGNIMNLVSLGVYPQLVVKAIIIILAVLLKSISSRATSR